MVYVSIPFMCVEYEVYIEMYVRGGSSTGSCAFFGDETI
jgi:hypothetical protein